MKTIFDRLVRLAAGSPLRRNVSAGSLAYVGHVVIGLAALPIYLHFLGYELYGVWVVIATLVGFSHVANLGVSAAVTKFVAELAETGDTEGLEAHVSTAAVLLAGSGVLVVVVLALARRAIAAAFGLAGDNGLLVARLLPVAGVLVALALVNKAFEGTLIGLGRMDVAVWSRLAARAGGLAVAVGTLAAGLGVASLLASQFAAEVLAGTAFVVAVRRQWGGGLCRWHGLRRDVVARLYRLGSGVASAGVLDNLLLPFSKFMITRFIGLSAVAVFDVANNVAQNLRSLSGAGVAAVLPEVSARTARGEDPRSVVLRLTSALAALSAVALAAVGVLAPTLLRIWLGSRFDPALVTPLRVLLVAAFLFLVGLPSHYAAIGLGRGGIVAAAAAVRTATNALAVALMVWVLSFSVVSAAWALVAAMGGASAVLVLRVIAVPAPALPREQEAM